jgi:hypothetical protein
LNSKRRLLKHPIQAPSLVFLYKFNNTVEGVVGFGQNLSTTVSESSAAKYNAFSKGSW